MKKISLILFFVIVISTSVFFQRSKEQNNKDDKNTGTPILNDSYLVSRVVDGDTIDVFMFGENKRIRIIGINTPEAVDPRREVECFGPEASNYAKELLKNKYVRLEIDNSQDNKDKYGRLLRHIILSDGRNFAELMVAGGYAREYTYRKASKYQKEYILAESEAKSSKLGMWADGACK